MKTARAAAVAEPALQLRQVKFAIPAGADQRTIAAPACGSREHARPVSVLRPARQGRRGRKREHAPGPEDGLLGAARAASGHERESRANDAPDHHASRRRALRGLRQAVVLRRQYRPRAGSAPIDGSGNGASRRAALARCQGGGVHRVPLAAFFVLAEAHGIRGTAPGAHNRRSRRDRTRHHALRLGGAHARGNSPFRPDRRCRRARGARARARARRPDRRTRRDRRSVRATFEHALPVLPIAGQGESRGRPARSRRGTSHHPVDRARRHPRAAGSGARRGDQSDRQGRALRRRLRFPGTHGISRCSCRGQGATRFTRS